MINLKIIEAQARERLNVSGNSSWGIDAIRAIRDGNRGIGNDLHKALNKNRPFGIKKFDKPDIDRGSWEADERDNSIIFQFIAFPRGSKDDSYLSGGCRIEVIPDGYEDDDPDSRSSKKALKSQLDMKCRVSFIADGEDSADIGDYEEFPVRVNITYDEILLV